MKLKSWSYPVPLYDCIYTLNDPVPTVSTLIIEESLYSIVASTTGATAKGELNVTVKLPMAVRDTENPVPRLTEGEVLPVTEPKTPKANCAHASLPRLYTNAPVLVDTIV